MAVDLGHSDPSDPFHDLPSPAFSFLPRTLGSAARPGTTVAPESLEPDLIKNLIDSTVLKSSAKLLDEVQVINKSHSSIQNMHSKVEEKTTIANGKDLSPERRPALGRKKARFSLMPTPRDSLPEIDYSSTIQIADPMGYYKALEQLENAEKELKKLKGEAPTDRTENWSTTARTRRTGILGRKASYKPQSHDNSDMVEESHTSELVANKRTHSPSHASTSMVPLDILHPEEIEQTGTSHAIRVNTDLSSSAEGKGLHAGKQQSADVLLEKLFSSFNAIGGDKGGALLQKHLQIKPNDLSRLNLNVLEGTENSHLRTVNTLVKKKFDGTLLPRSPTYETNILAAETALRRRISLQYAPKGPESMPPSDDAVISIDSPSSIYSDKQSLLPSGDTSRPATGGLVDGEASTPVIINEKSSSFMDGMHSPSVPEGTQSNDLGTMNTPTKNKSDSAQLRRRLPSYEKYALAIETSSQRRMSSKYLSEGLESVPSNDDAVVLINSSPEVHRGVQSLSVSGGTSHPVTGGLVNGDASTPEIMNDKSSSFVDERHSQSLLEDTQSDDTGAQNTLLKNKFDRVQLLPGSPSYERNTLTAEAASQRRISLKYSSEGPESVPPNGDLQSFLPSSNTNNSGTSGVVNSASIPVIINEKCSNLIDEMHSPSILEGTQNNDLGTLNNSMKRKFGEKMHSPSHEERSIANSLTSAKEVTNHTSRSIEKGTCPSSISFDNSEGNVSTEVDEYFGEEMNIMAEREPVSDAELSKDVSNLSVAAPPVSVHLPNSCVLQEECNAGLEKACGSTPTREPEGEINRNVQEKTKQPLKRLKKLASKRQSLGGAGLAWQAGVRRSTRIRSRPLQYWRGERLLYGRIHNSLATVIGVKYVEGNDKCPQAMVESFVSDQYKDLVSLAGLH